MSKNISFCIYNISKLDEEGCFERLNQYKTDILFKNGSKIESYKSSKTIRSYRSKLLSFYCLHCNVIHIDYSLNKIQWMGEQPYCERIILDATDGIVSNKTSIL